MILHVLKNKGSDREIDKQTLKYYQRPEKIYKPRLQGSNRPLKRSWMKINLSQNEFKSYSESRVLE